jgi:uncharacterized protein (TIGR03435 family)
MARTSRHDEKCGLGFLPGRGQKIEIRGMNAAELIAAAYRMPLTEIQGPSWMSDVQFDIDALIPAGHTRDQAPDMLRVLLEQRLGLKAHREVRKSAGYILSVRKEGPKLQEAGSFTPTTNPGGGANRPPVSGLREQLDHCDMAELARTLSQNLAAPVEDQTGLKGFYAFVLQIPRSETKDGLDRPAQLRQALSAYGLRLTAKEIEAPLLIVENLSRIPTPN